MPLRITTGARSMTMARYEPFVVETQSATPDEKIDSLVGRRQVITWYLSGAVENLEQWEGVRGTDATGDKFQYIADGTFSGKHYGRGTIRYDITDLMDNSAIQIVTGTLTITEAAPFFADYDESPISRYCAKIKFYNDPTTPDPVQPVVSYGPFVPLGTYIPPSTALKALALSSTTMTRGQPFSANILNATTGSTIAGTMPAGLVLDGAARKVTGTPNVSGMFNLMLAESLTGANSRSTTISITVAEPAPILAVLSISNTNAQVGQAFSALITGAANGSTLTATGLPAGLTLNSAARTISGTPTTAGSPAFTLIETLSGATGSPKSNSVQLTIQSASVTPEPAPGSSWSFDRSNLALDATSWTWDGTTGLSTTVPVITLALSVAQSVAEGTPSAPTPTPAIMLALSAAQAIAEGNLTSNITLALSGAQAVAEGT